MQVFIIFIIIAMLASSNIGMASEYFDDIVDTPSNDDRGTTHEPASYEPNLRGGNGQSNSVVIKDSQITGPVILTLINNFIWAISDAKKDDDKKDDDDHDDGSHKDDNRNDADNWSIPEDANT